jgi:ATP synthase I chain
MSGSDVIGRFVRTLAVVVAVLAIVAYTVRPAHPRFALGVAGGGVLAALALWALRGVVEQTIAATKSGEIGRNSRGAVLVKFFTRHAILALTAYGMMLRLQLDPVGIVVGVSALWVAAAVEAVRSNPK